ncbi:translin [Cynara cardunculus var. scolymus]|uniref:Translin n=1 Tax=Cynara cardunculus var. scolymus TaxID=59895 RepID=A0A103XZX9_CYNCS|nr:translin [Cynara cardunculus var. scolymus]KVH99983.1 Translin [Cynara cardunculus var. scolymus]
MMKSAFRTALVLTTTVCHRSLNPNPITLLSLRTATASPPPNSTTVTCRKIHCNSFSSSMAGGDSSPTVAAVEKQFDEFRNRLEESGSLRDRIRAVATEIESTTRMMYSSLLLVHQSRPIPEVLENAKTQIDVLKQLFSSLAEIVRERPGQYYRYHGDWRTETQQVVSLLAFMHWLETGSLLIHTEVEEKLGLNASEFGLDVEDYLIGICFMSNELPRYVVNQVTAGDYDCPRKVLKFLTDLHASFRLLNLRNDFLRKKFDGMKYDLRRVEEVYYDVKIRGLASNKGESKEDQTIEES